MFSEVTLEEELAPNVEARAVDEIVLALLAACVDIEDRCGEFKRFCGKNSHVTERCPKTCELCSKSLYLQFYLLNSFQNINGTYIKKISNYSSLTNDEDLIRTYLTHGLAFQQHQQMSHLHQLLRQ